MDVAKPLHCRQRLLVSEELINQIGKCGWHISLKSTHCAKLEGNDITATLCERVWVR